MTGKRVGYVRVSTIDQNPDRQLESIPLDKRFVDHASASTTDRPKLKLLLDYVREGDTVIIHSMDRLARNLLDLKRIVRDLVNQKVKVEFIKERLTFDGNDNAMANLLLSLMGAFAEFEHAFIRERQLEGIAIAKRQGKYRGGKRKLNADKIDKLKELMLTRRTKSSISRELGVSRFTLYKYLEEIKQQERI